MAIDELPQAFWQNLKSIAEVQFVRSGTEAYRNLTSQCFDMAFVDLHLTGMDGLELLRRIHSEQLCAYVILTSSVPSFSYAQQGILSGASAYLLRPLQESEVEKTVLKMVSEAADSSGHLQKAATYVAERLRTEDAAAALAYARVHLLPTTPDEIQNCLQLRNLWLEIVNQTYLHYPWLKLYHQWNEYTTIDYVQDPDSQLLLKVCQRRVLLLSQTVLELFPVTEDSLIDKIERTLLQTVDDNPQQKTIAEQFYLAGSTLSVRFQKQLGISYREYMTRLRIFRGQYLLRYTDIPVDQLAGKLGYKDREYFAKLFLQRTGNPLHRNKGEKWSDFQI